MVQIFPIHENLRRRSPRDTTTSVQPCRPHSVPDKQSFEPAVSEGVFRSTDKPQMLRFSRCDPQPAIRQRPMSRRKCRTHPAYRGRTFRKLRDRQPLRYKAGDHHDVGRRQPRWCGSRRFGTAGTTGAGARPLHCPSGPSRHCSHRHPMAARVAMAVTRTGCPARPAHSWAPVTSPTLCRPSNPGSSGQRSHTRSQIPRA